MKILKRKKLLATITSFILVLCLTAFVSCSQGGNGGFVNPGDNLGGGGTAENPDAVVSSEIENLISAAGVVDFGALKEDVSLDGAVALSDNTAEITENGVYILSGSYTKLSVKKGVTARVILNGATISNTNGNAFSTGKNCEITLTVSGENYISNAGEDVNALHVKGTLKINGDGVLTVKSDSKSAVKVSKGLYVTGATLNLTAVNHGVSASFIATDSAKIKVLSSGKDGLHAECDYDEPDDESACVFTVSEGFVSMLNTDYECNVKGDGIQADTFVYIDGGNYNIVTEGDFVTKTAENMATYGLTADDFRFVRRGRTYEKVASDYKGSSTLYAPTQGCKGIKAGEIEYDLDGDGEDDKIITENADYTIMIKSGNITVDSSADAVHSNTGDVYIYGGKLVLSTYDDGITADNLVKIYGGEISVESSYEGIEGAYVEISDGTINVNASDDGLNAASDDESVVEHIIISGGFVTVKAYGDGIDSNGSVLISGGKVIVHGPVNGGNGGLDSDRGVLVTGGTLFVTSALGMVETPGKNSTQYVLSFASESNLMAGSVIGIKDSDGNELLSVELEHSCRSVIVSLNEFEKNANYSIYKDNELLSEFTITGILTYVGSNMGAGGQNGGMGGMGTRPGGNPPQRN